MTAQRPADRDLTDDLLAVWVRLARGELQRRDAAVELHRIASRLERPRG